MQDAIYVAVTWEIIWYRFANWYNFLENVTIHMTFLGAVADDIRSVLFGRKSYKKLEATFMIFYVQVKNERGSLSFVWSLLLVFKQLRSSFHVL